MATVAKLGMIKMDNKSTTEHVTKANDNRKKLQHKMNTCINTMEMEIWREHEHMHQYNEDGDMERTS